MQNILPQIALGNSEKEYNKERREKVWERLSNYLAWQEGGKKPKELTPEPEKKPVYTIPKAPPISPDATAVRIKNQIDHQRILHTRREKLEKIGLAFQEYQQRNNISLFELPAT